jgi:uncharacterized zinc-type alcohol dehydrogenase-like protein
MSTPIHAYAAREVGGSLSRFDYTPPALGLGDVRIDVTHCGICHSDLHLIDNELGNTVFPFVPGHEIVGRVSAVGAGVTHLSVGQRVGVGPFRHACLHCALCANGQDNLCPHLQFTILGHHGGFANAIQVSASHAFAIPDALESALAAPLLCAGLTVYAPLRAHTDAATRVGVLGIGGLGHLAVQYARARGSEVTVFSTTAAKEEQARKLGADRFIVLNDPAALASAAGSIDFLLSTGFGAIEWMGLMSLLRPNGRLCIVGSSLAPLNVPAGLLIMSQHTISGSAAGSRADMMEMLEFSARRRIHPWIETLPLAEVNKGLARVRSGDVRYRLVLEV